MTQEEFQTVVLKELYGLKEDVSGLKKDMLDVRMRLQNVERDVSDLKEDVSGLKEDVSCLKEDVSVLKGQVAENTSIPKAALHNQEFVQAFDERQRIHGESINLLAIRQLRIEAEIKLLKKAQ